MTTGTVLVRSAARYADRASLWAAVAIGFAIPVSTALDSLLVAALLLCWIAGGGYREKLAAIRGNEFAIVACALFLLSVAGSAYSVGTASDVQYALGKASRLLLIPVLISLRPEREYQERALRAFKAAVVLTLVLSFLVWLGLMPDAGFFKRTQIEPVVFKLRITHSVLMSFGAFAFALQAREAADWRSRLLPALVAGLAAFNVFYMVPGRTGQLVLLALLLYFFFSWLRWRGLLVAAAAGATIAGTAYLAPSSALHRRVQTTIVEIGDWRAGKPAQFGNMRLEAASNSVEIVKSHPWVGAGTGGFAAAYARQVQGTSMMPLPQPENQYLLTAVQMGVVGLAALLALFALQWHLASRLATRTETDLARALVITMAVGCLFNSFLLDHTESLFYAWLTGLLFASLRPGRNGVR
jgi:O-antigen ligase